VGPPYFNLFFVPLICVLALLMAAGSVLRWKRNDGEFLRRHLQWPLIVSLGAGVLLAWLQGGGFHAGATLTWIIVLWVVAVTLRDLWLKSAHSLGRLQGLRRLRGSYYGMVIAHLGLAASILGAGLTSIYSQELDVRMAAGSSVNLGQYRFEFGGVNRVGGPNYTADQATVMVYRGDRQVALLHPAKRRYAASGQVMTEAGIDAGLLRDVYVALGEPLEAGAWAVRLHIKPYVRWLWLGALLMAGGGLLAMFDKRYRRVAVAAATPAAVSAAGTPLSSP